jgi:uncharacterized protein YndB with AHSA1/START domain
MTDSETLRMERTFQAPAEAVLEAWTSEDVIRRGWHAGHDWKTTGRSRPEGRGVHARGGSPKG